MAISGSYDVLYSRNEIITEALELLSVIEAGETPTSEDFSTCSRTLNMMVKFWQSRGIALWRNKQIYVFFQPSTAAYTLGPTGTSPAGSSLVKTEVALAASSGASSLLVDSVTGISSGDNIGVELDDGTIQWTTVNGAPTTTIPLAAVLTDDVSVDAHVYTYTSGIQRPLFITEARLHRNDGTEIPLHPAARNDYLRLATKTTTGTPSQYYYDPQLTNGVLYVWPISSTVKDYLVLTARMPLADFDSADDDPDFPQEWLLPLSYNLAVLVAPKYEEEVSQDFKAMAAGMLESAIESAVDFGSMYLEVE